MKKALLSLIAVLALTACINSPQSKGLEDINISCENWVQMLRESGYTDEQMKHILSNPGKGQKDCSWAV